METSRLFFSLLHSSITAKPLQERKKKKKRSVTLRKKKIHSKYKTKTFHFGKISFFVERKRLYYLILCTFRKYLFFWLLTFFFSLFFVLLHKTNTHFCELHAFRFVHSNSDFISFLSTQFLTPSFFSFFSPCLSNHHGERRKKRGKTFLRRFLPLHYSQYASYCKVLLNDSMNRKKKSKLNFRKSSLCGCKSNRGKL